MRAESGAARGRPNLLTGHRAGGAGAGATAGTGGAGGGVAGRGGAGGMVHVIDFVTVPISPVEKVVLTDTVNGPVGARYGRQPALAIALATRASARVHGRASPSTGRHSGEHRSAKAAIGRPRDGDGCR